MLGCVLRAAGRQGTGALFNLAGYWVFGLPLSLALCFWARLATVGLWAGLASASFLQGVVFLVLVATLDWGAEVERARRLTAGAMARHARDGGGGGGCSSGGGEGGKEAGDEETGAAAAVAPGQIAAEGGRGGEGGGSSRGEEEEGLRRPLLPRRK